jgi:hypothetical protein
MVWFLAFTRMRDDGVSAAAVVASTDSQSPGSELGVSEKPPCRMRILGRALFLGCRRSLQAPDWREVKLRVEWCFRIERCRPIVSMPCPGCETLKRCKEHGPPVVWIWLELRSLQGFQAARTVIRCTFKPRELLQCASANASS